MARTLRSDIAAAGAAVARVWRGSPGWVTGAVTGIQAAVLGAGMLVALALGAVASAPTVDGSVDADWGGAAAVAIDLWLLSHHMAVEIGGAEVSVAPLGITIALAGILAAVARRFCEPTTGGWFFAVASYCAAVVITGAVAVPTATARELLSATAVAAALAGGGVWWGLRAGHGFDPIPVRRAPRWLRVGWRLGAGSSAVVAGVGAAIALAWVVAGAARIGEVGAGLHPDAVGAVVAALGSAAVVPTIAAWALAWATGQGFAVGEGTRYAPAELTSGPLPAIPALGGLPDAAGGALVWAPILIVAAGVAARLALGRVTLPAPQAAASYAVAAGVMWGATSTVQTLAAGSLGPGALSEAGAHAVWVATVATALVGLGVALAVGGAAAVRYVAARRTGPPADPRHGVPRP